MPSYFIPARNSRHRTACFALYKALIQRARQVPLPEHVAYREPDKPYVHPIHRFVRHSFQQNRADVSPRLVFAALKAGYKFLDLLDAAKTPESTAHKQVVSYLEQRAPPKRVKDLRFRDRKREKERAKAERKALREAGKPIPGETDRHPPVIVRRVIPGSERMSRDGILTHVYEYVPGSPSRPLEEIPGGVRPVPILTTESNGIPFLRMGKPQPPALHRMLFHKIKKRRTRSMMASAMTRDGLDNVALEDDWEYHLLTQAKKDAPHDKGAADFVRNAVHESTYRHSVSLGIAYLSAQLNVETADMIARARGLLQIVDRERTLAEKEAKEREEREAKLQKEGQEGELQTA